MDMEISVVRNRNGVGGDNGQPEDEKQQHQTKYTENRDQSLLFFTLITMECNCCTLNTPKCEKAVNFVSLQGSVNTQLDLS